MPSIRKVFVLLITAFAVIFSTAYGQQAGRSAVIGKDFNKGNLKIITGSSFAVPVHNNTAFATTVYTFGDLTVFSYFDNTSITVYDKYNSVKATAVLGADTMFTIQPGSGIYRVEGNKTYTVLVGDAVSKSTNGYFAVDEAGRGLSTKLNTWMMKQSYLYDDFIVFAYQNNTGFTVKNLETDELIYAGTLNKGEHYSFRDAGKVPYSTPLQVTATQPVSALSYTDQDYYVPSSNGTFTGTAFYGYSSYNGYWTNSITVTSYSDNNNISIVNSVTGESINSYTAQKGQVHTESINAPTYWTVTSTYPVSAANIPFAGWSGNYYYMTRAIDETGKGFGKLFYVPTIGSRIDVFSFDPSNSVSITELGLYDTFPYTSTNKIWEGTLQEGESYNFNSPSGKYVYLIEGTGNLSVLQSNGGAGADFMPLAYSLDYPDLAISSSDISFSKADSLLMPGDKINITVTVHNFGSVNATNVNFIAYEGDPDAGGNAPPVGSGIISSISPGGSGSKSFSYTVPTQPEYRSIVVKVDPSNAITESNKSNNKAKRSLKPNNELLPPLAVSVTAPNSLALVNGQPSPNPFTVKYDIFNTGTVAADNVSVTLELFNGLTLNAGSLNQSVGQIAGNGSARVEFQIKADPNVSGFNFYKATITSSNAATKIINRAINVPDAVAPAAPLSFKGTAGNGGSASFTWTANTDADLAGYLLYYSTDGVNWNATGADQGNSPILILSSNSFTISGLPLSDPNGTDYWFVLKAFDSSNNTSSESNTVKLNLTSSSSAEEIVFYGNSAFLYSVQDGTGYVSGPNNYNDLGKYERIDISGTKTLKEIRIYFGDKTVNGTADNFNVVVRNTDAAGAPAELLYNIPTTTDQIDVSDPAVKFNSYQIPSGLNLNGNFFIGVEWDSTNNDQFGIVSDSSGEGEGMKRAWEKWSDGTYHDILSSWQGLDVDLWIAAVFTTVTGVDKEISQVPSGYNLAQNYPNPFNPSTRIKYAIAQRGYVTLKVYDMLGRNVADLVNGERSAGTYELSFDASGLSTGIYFYKLQVYNSNNPSVKVYGATKKLILIK